MNCFGQEVFAASTIHPVVLPAMSQCALTFDERFGLDSWKLDASAGRLVHQWDWLG